MGTYSGAISQTLTTFDTSITSSNGNITANQVLYTCPAGYKAIVQVNTFYNTLSGSVNSSVVLQTKSPHNSAYVTMTSATLSGTTTANQATYAAVAGQTIADVGRSASDFNGGVPGNMRIILMPEDRLLVNGGTCANGSNLRVCGQVELLRSAF